jgi:hypothetical protein
MLRVTFAGASEVGPFFLSVSAASRVGEVFLQQTLETLGWVLASLWPSCPQIGSKVCLS